MVGEKGAHWGCFTNRTKKLERDVATGESFLGGRGAAAGLVLPRGSWQETEQPCSTS